MRSSLPGRLLILYLLLLVAQACAGAAWQTDLGPSPFELFPERLLTTNPAVQADYPAVAWNGADFLVVWSERRGSGTELFAVRISPDGDLADQAPWVVSMAPGVQTRPAVAWGGGVFLVVWEDSRLDFLTKIFGSRVSPEGVLLDPKGFAIADSRLSQTGPAVIWTGSGFLVVWNEDLGGSIGLDLYGVMVDPGAAVTAAQRIPIATAPGNQYEVALAWGLHDGLIVWSDERKGSGTREMADLLGIRVDQDGRLFDSSELVISDAAGGQHDPALVWDGQQYVLFWLDQRKGNDEIFAARMTADGRLLDRHGLQMTLGVAPAGPPTVISQTGRLIGAWPRDAGGQKIIQGRVWEEGFGLGDSVTSGADLSDRGAGGEIGFIASPAAVRLLLAGTSSHELLLIWSAVAPGTVSDSRVYVRAMELLPFE